MDERIIDFEKDELLSIFNQAILELTKIKVVSDKIKTIDDKITNIMQMSTTELRKAKIQLLYKNLPKQRKRLISFITIAHFFAVILFCLMFYQYGLFDSMFNRVSDVSARIPSYIIYGFVGIEIFYIRVIMPTIQKTNSNIARTEYITKLEEEKSLLHIEYDEVYREYADKIYLIPIDYRQLEIIETMQRYIINMRADNWKDCTNQYEIEKRMQQL